ncbi:MAG TPA: MBL fold metallo-hydrolase [Opitutaceae bacterium]|nr:MBL fold metallo-hydrolase [Opitutaceae bacterium]
MKRWSGRVLGLLVLAVSAVGQVNEVRSLAPGVYFHGGDFRRGHSNNGWIVFEDYVLLIDANFPSGAEVVLPKIKAITDRPVRFAFDTHHHGDHAYGNQFWVEQGAVPIAHTGAIAEMREREPAHWDNAAKNRPDVAASKLKLPSVGFPDRLFFDDGRHRVELIWLGVGHTKGDGFAWLPKEKILFTGDAAVNGAYNYVGDAHIGEWIKTLERAKALGAEIVCPGHGPMGGPEILADQQAYFIALYAEVQALRDAGRTPAQVKEAVPAIRDNLKKTERIARYVPAGLTGVVDKVWTELGGVPLPK